MDTAAPPSVPDTATEPRLQLQSQYLGLEPRASGGLGQVYETTDCELQRPVAIKVLLDKWCASQQACHDFLLEAQLTSQLEHPGIVPIYQVGATSDGRPCYSMRLIQGQTLRQAIDAYHQLPSDQLSVRRLALRRLINQLTSVCRTIAYAHSKGVLHRDIKPENIMLGEFGEAIVLDWGLARSSNSDEALTEPVSDSEVSTVYTTQVRGTLAYLSPEQAGGEHGTVTSASDVFALGATLYTLLCNRPPYQELTRYDSLQRAITANYDKPSSIQPVPRVLEAICLKAMVKDPGKRYLSASAMADDLDRYLADEPVSAYPEPWTDRLRRSILRHKPLYAVLLAVLLVIPTALAIGSWLLAAERTKTLLSEQKAHLQENSARQITEYLTRLFENADPLASALTGFRMNDELNQLQTAVAFLERGQALIGQHLKDQPLQRARLQYAMCRTYHSLGAYEAARSLAKECHDLLNHELGPYNVEVINSRQLLGQIANDTGNYEEARTLFEDVLKRRRERWGNDHLQVAETLYSLGTLAFLQPFSERGPQFEAASRKEAEKLLLESLRIRQKLHSGPHPEIGFTYAALGSLNLSEPGAGAKVKEYIAEAGKHFQSASSKDSLGTVVVRMIEADKLRNQKKFVEAEKIYAEVLVVMKKYWGSRHPLTIMHMANYVGLVNASSDLERALRMARELLELIRPMPYFRSQPMIVERMIYFSDVEVNRGNKQEGCTGYLEAMKFARERLQANQRNIEKLTTRFREHGLPLPTP